MACRTGFLLGVFCLIPCIAQAEIVVLVNSYDTNSIKSYDASTGAYIDDFVTAGSGGLTHPVAMVLGPDHNLYVSCYDINAILRFDGRTGTFLGVFASGVSGMGMAFGQDGNLYVSGIGNNEIDRFDGTTGAFLGMFARITIPGDSGSLVFGADGDLYAGVYSGNYTAGVARYDGQTGAYLGQFVPMGSGGLRFNPEMVFGPDGNLYISKGGDGGVNRYNGSTGAFLDQFIQPGSGAFNTTDIAFGTDNNLYLINASYSRVLRYDGQTGQYIGTFIPSGSGGLQGAMDLLLDDLSPVPEPSTLALWSGVGAMGLVMAWRRRKSAA